MVTYDGAKTPRKQRPADCDADRSPVLFSCPSTGKSHCVLIISKLFTYYPFHLSFKLESQMRRNMPLTKESNNKEKHKQQYPNFCNKIKWDSYSKHRRLARKRTAVHVSNSSLLMFPLNLSKQASIFNLFSRSCDTTPKRQHLKKFFLNNNSTHYLKVHLLELLPEKQLYNQNY